MKHKYILLNAFTQTHFNGAQIAVFIQSDKLSEKQKIKLAKELNLTETVFISSASQAACDAKFEIFTAEGKSGFAGHAIVAASYVMAELGMVQGSDMRIELNEQELNIIQSLKNKKVQINIPVSEKYDEYVPSNKELAEIIGLTESDIGYQNYKAMIAGCPEPSLMIPLKNHDTLRKAKFHENKWQLSFVASLAKNILLFTGDHPYDSINYTARLMSKGMGVNEDPPIGAVAPSLGLYLAHDINDYHRSCLIQRGDENSRMSVMEINVDKEGSKVTAVQLGGHAVKMAEGYFDLPNE